MKIKRDYGGWLAIGGMVLVFLLLISPTTKSKKTLEEEILELKEENFKLKKEIEELNAKIELLLSRIEKLEKSQPGVGKAGDSFEEMSGTALADSSTGIQPNPNLRVLKVEPKAEEKTEPVAKTIVIVNQEKKEPVLVKSEGAKEELEEVKRLMEEKKYPEAEKLIRKQLSGKPSAKSACLLYYYLAESQGKLGKREDSVRSYLELSDRYPACDYAPEALYKAGEGYERLGKKEEARKIFQELVALYPFSKYANLAEEKLKK